MGTLLLVKIPLLVGYLVITKKAVIPVLEGTVDGIRDGVRAVKAEKKNRNNKEN